MSTQALAGHIATHGIDEHRLITPPWEVELRQVSPGPFTASIDFAQVNGILLARSRRSPR